MLYFYSYKTDLHFALFAFIICVRIQKENIALHAKHGRLIYIECNILV